MLFTVQINAVISGRVNDTFEKLVIRLIMRLLHPLEITSGQHHRAKRALNTVKTAQYRSKHQTPANCRLIRREPARQIQGGRSPRRMETCLTTVRAATTSTRSKCAVRQISELSTLSADTTETVSLCVEKLHLFA